MYTCLVVFTYFDVNRGENVDDRNMLKYLFSLNDHCFSKRINS